MIQQLLPTEQAIEKENPTRRDQLQDETTEPNQTKPNRKSDRPSLSIDQRPEFCYLFGCSVPNSIRKLIYRADEYLFRVLNEAVYLVLWVGTLR